MARRKTKLIVALLFALIFGSIGASRSDAQKGTAADALDQRIRAEISGFKGRVSLFAENIDTGKSYGFGADDRVRTASTIKVPIMVEVFARVAEGKAKWTDELILTEASKVSGSGILLELSDGLRLNLRDAVRLMIVVSDNTATNLLLDRITTDAVNDRMDSLGLRQTRVLRKVGGGGESRAGAISENKRFGLGVSTPREMVMLLEKLERGEVISPEASREMIAIMKRQQYRDGIPRALRGVEVANKTGALDRLRSDVGIVYTSRGRIALAITCDDMPETLWSVDNPGLILISRLAKILVEELGR
ncbi:MAG: serine hydrolase [Pyrinomonas sp.]|uniref:serine hydrolase n=1 Tax=Pyrinomonas sp. TaxID=2080306 RepID=UPI003330C562